MNEGNERKKPSKIVATKKDLKKVKKLLLRETKSKTHKAQDLLNEIQREEDC